MTPNEVIEKYGRGFFFGSSKDEYLRWYYAEGDSLECHVTTGHIFPDCGSEDEWLEYVENSKWDFLDKDGNKVDSPVWYDAIKTPCPQDSFTDLKNLAASAQMDVMFTSDANIHLYDVETELQLTVTDIEAVREFLKERIRYIESRDKLGEWK